jgi:geranylgeranyl diphosphate synthase type I
MLQRTISECGAVEEIEAKIADNHARATAVHEEAPLSPDARAELGTLARAVTRRTS